MEAVAHHERLYWDDACDQIGAELAVNAAIGGFFTSAARILTTPDAPCGCSDLWIAFDFDCHHIVTHLLPGMQARDAGGNAVDGHHVPVPYFGFALEMKAFEDLGQLFAK
ncbi:hypothetical protein U1872_10775 [Sphingomonas sp. RB3P16]|uniref:hypothetical protein n=1 Tax=Parasphingomonas frigoris TaxID=3096163 RepID=UPI002FC96F5A